MVLLGDRAYKMKKPVRFGFLDFTDREARRAACQEEVALNRRLAPDVYEGVADVIGPDGRPCEHLIVMRRMPAERRLAVLARSGAPVGEHLRRIARQVASLHARARRGPEIDREGGGRALRARWTANLAEVRELHGGPGGSGEPGEPGQHGEPREHGELGEHGRSGRSGESGGPGSPVGAAALGAIERLALRFVDGREPLFRARVEQGRIVDGHGDLLAEDIFCLDDGPRILDCLEFDERLRFVDGLDDAAFLAMDLERLGAPGEAVAFLDHYAEFSGDPSPPCLVHHYVAYRAFVRAKVACLRHGQGGTGAGREAGELAELALRHLRAGAVTLVLVGGPPGTGKSALAGAVADRLGYTLLSSDRIRKEMAGLTPRTRAAAPFEEGIYRPEWTERTYGELLSRAERLLGLGEPVVLDASWTGAAHRSDAERVARRTFTDLVALRCAAPARVVAERLARRTAGVSDAGQAVSEAMAARTPPWPGAVEIDTGGAVEDALDQALGALRPPCAPAAPRFPRPRLEPG
ncbi:bifunctional aminoglycoside phosphotransferase/ATP-binding protein [Sphaerisporangium rhizosphaerae]|uniref:AAA family ATPase n=1 Tax=Sphaerisporangium rhizosphaerae TaxID=2269375 RepID=A0ABW2P5R8_9ACTN